MKAVPSFMLLGPVLLLTIFQFQACDPLCINNGTCYAQMHCKCRNGYYGDHCQYGGYTNNYCQTRLSNESQIEGISKGGVFATYTLASRVYHCQWRIWGSSENVVEISQVSVQCFKTKMAVQNKAFLKIYDITTSGQFPLLGEFNSTTVAATTVKSTTSSVFILLTRSNDCQNLLVTFGFEQKERPKTPNIESLPGLEPPCWPMTKIQAPFEKDVVISRLPANPDTFEFCQWMFMVPEHFVLIFHISMMALVNDGFFEIFKTDFRQGNVLETPWTARQMNQYKEKSYPWQEIAGPAEVMFFYYSRASNRRQIEYEITAMTPECSVDCGLNGRCKASNACFCTQSTIFGDKCQYDSQDQNVETCDSNTVEITANGRAHFQKNETGTCVVTLRSSGSQKIRIDDIIVRGVKKNGKIKKGLGNLNNFFNVKVIPSLEVTVTITDSLQSAVRADLDTTKFGNALLFTSKQSEVYIELNWNTCLTASVSFRFILIYSKATTKKTTQSSLPMSSVANTDIATSPKSLNPDSSGNTTPNNNDVTTEPYPLGSPEGLLQQLLYNNAYMSPDVPEEKAIPVITAGDIHCTDFSSEVTAPPTKDGKALPVRVIFFIEKFFEIDAKQETINVHGILQTRWNITTCSHNSTNVRITQPERVFKADHHKVWRLPLTYDNSHDDLAMRNPELVDHFIFVVDPRDFRLEFFYSKIGTFSSNCDLEFRKFPFDRQNCSFEFAIKRSSKLVEFSEIELLTPKQFGDAKEFEIEYAHNYKNTRIRLSPTLALSTSVARFIIVMRRKPYYFFINVVGPCQVLTLIQFGAYLLPAGSSERPMFTVTILLALTVAQNQVIQGVPEKPDPILISEYIFALSILTGANLMHSLLLCALANSKRCSSIKINKCCGRKTKLVTLVDIFGFLLIAGFFAAVNLYALNIISHEVKLTSD